jgi:hypothetical protein
MQDEYDSGAAVGDISSGLDMILGTCFLPILVIGLLFFFRTRNGGGSSSTEPWVLKTFQIDQTGVSGAHLFIEARKPGLMAFILNLLGLDDTASLKVTRGMISFRKSSLFGLIQTSTGLTQIGSFQGGYSKPLLFLVLSFFSFFMGTFIDLSAQVFPYFTIIGGVMGFVFLIVYVLQKNLMFGFETSGGAYYGLAFKRGILNGVSVDIAQVETAITLVNALIGSASLGSSYNESHNVSRFTKQGTVGAVAARVAPPQHVVPQAQVPIPQAQIPVPVPPTHSVAPPPPQNPKI